MSPGLQVLAVMPTDRIKELTRELYETVHGDVEAALDLGEDADLADERGEGLIDNKNGIVVRPKTDLEGLDVRLSQNVDGLARVYLFDADNPDPDDVLDWEDVHRKAAGDVVEVRTPLEAGKEYLVVADALYTARAGDRTYTRGRAECDFPVENDALAVTGGWYGTKSESYRYNFAEVAPIYEPYDPVAESDVRRPAGTDVIDVVESDAIDHQGDLGAEIMDYVGDSTDPVEFVLPNGDYTTHSEIAFSQPIEYFEIRGEPHATLKVRSNSVGMMFTFGSWGDSDPPENVVIRNLSVDISDQKARDAGFLSAHWGRALVDTVELVGARDRHGPNGGDRYTFMVNTMDSGAETIVRNASLPDAEHLGDYGHSVGYSIAFNSEPTNRGTNVWDRCYVGDFIDNGFYVANSGGKNLVIGSGASNTGNGNLRLGDGDEARRCHVYLDDSGYKSYPGAGLWLNGDASADDITVDGSDAGNDVVRVNSACDEGRIGSLTVYTGGSCPSPSVRLTSTGDTSEGGVVIEDFEVVDDSEETESSTGNTIPVIRASRGDITLKDGDVEAAARTPLTGSPTVDNVSGV